MMPTIRIDDDVWEFLQKQARPFVDSPNDVLRRLLLAPDQVMRVEPRAEISLKTGATEIANNRIEEDFTGHRITGYRLHGRKVLCRTFKELLVNLSNELRSSDHAAFDKVALRLHGTKRSYFSKNPNDLKFPLQLTGHGMFVETNLNANLIAGICRDLIKGLGIKEADFEIESSL